MSKWSEETATECGHTVYVHEDWDGPPRFCKECKEANDAKWHEKQCEGRNCSNVIRHHENWDHPPKYCKECKAKFYEKQCEAKNCSNTIRCHKDWEHEPRYCKECKNKFRDTNLSCTICGSSFIWSAGSQRKAEENGWEQPKKCHECRGFIKETPSIKIDCKFCYNTMEWNSFQQLMERHKEWRPPSICLECKQDRSFLISGALADFQEKVYVIDEKLLGACKYLAAVYSAKDDLPIAHISIERKLGEGRIAVTTNLANTTILPLPYPSRHTKIESRFGERKVATTYGNKKGKKETRIEERLFEDEVIISKDTKSGQSTVKRVRKEKDVTYYEK